MRSLCTSSSVKEGSVRYWPATWSVVRLALSPLFGPIRLFGPRGVFWRRRRSGPKKLRVRCVGTPARQEPCTKETR